MAVHNPKTAHLSGAPISLFLLLASAALAVARRAVALGGPLVENYLKTLKEIESGKHSR